MEDGTVGSSLSAVREIQKEEVEGANHVEPNTNWEIPVTESVYFDVTDAAILQRDDEAPTIWSHHSDITSKHVTLGLGADHPHRHGNKANFFRRRGGGAETQDYGDQFFEDHTKCDADSHQYGYTNSDANDLDSSTPEGFLSNLSGFFNSQSTEKYKHNLVNNQIIYGINPSKISANFTTNETHTGFSLWMNESNYNNITSSNSTLSAEEDNTAIGLLGDISLGFVLGFLCMATFVGNAMVLHAVRTEKRLQTVSPIFPCYLKKFSKSRHGSLHTRGNCHPEKEI